MAQNVGACCGPVPPSEVTVPFPFAGSFPPNGHIFYRDDYGQLYEVVWETIRFGEDFLLDFTVITKQPYVWGEIDQGFVANRVVFRRGICTTWRFIIGPHDDGYEIVAEGMSQIICVFQSTFNCETQPKDEFVHHLDSMVCDEIENRVACGSRFVDPVDPGDVIVLFQDIDTAGDPVDIPGSQPFQFVNVWAQDDILTAVCDDTGVTSIDFLCLGVGIDPLGEGGFCIGAI